MTVKCNYSTRNLYRLLTHLAKPKQNGRFDRAFQKCLAHIAVCEAVSTLYLASSQESPAHAGGDRGKVYG